MRLIVADTSPIFYLLSIGHIDLLSRLFGKVLLPGAVDQELCHPAAPSVAHNRVPPWAEVTPLTRSTILCSNHREPENQLPSPSRCRRTRISFLSMSAKERPSRLAHSIRTRLPRDILALMSHEHKFPAIPAFPLNRPPCEKTLPRTKKPPDAPHP